jgi:RecB family exonuclease
MAKTQIPALLKEIKNKAVREINYQNDKTISYSQFSIYAKCPFRWGLEYREGYRIYQPSMAAVFGTSVHVAMQHYIQVMFDKSGAEADRVDIEDFFQQTFMGEYKKTLKENKGVHFSSASEMREYYEDGLAIIEYFKKNKSEYFSTRKWALVGIEMPLVQPIAVNHPNVYLKGYIDFVLYNENTNKIKIFDIKTSKNGWRDKEKKDELKMQQIILYKEYFAKQYNIDPEQIDIEFFIVKRKLYENLDFPQKRIQIVEPASGKGKRNKAVSHITEFINTVFNADGTYKSTELIKNVSKESCQWCPFKDNKELCNKDSSF